MNKILIVHPEGNINNNPNLSSMVEILAAEGYIVAVSSVKRAKVAQDAPCCGVEMLLFERDNISSLEGKCALAGKKFSSDSDMLTYVDNEYDDFDLIIGVDRGIIEASIIATAKKVPFGLISYEIFFEDETGREFKIAEREACRGLTFAVVPDKTRAKLLARENRIVKSKMINIPVAPSGSNRALRNNYLNDLCNIPKDKKIALFAGSVDDWSMAEYMLESARRWDNGWVLLVHNRYGLKGKALTYYDKYKDIDNIYFSQASIDTTNEMSEFLHGADVGLAFYKAQPNDIWVGKNIGNIGLASGKLSMYLKHGLPIVVNSIGLMADCVHQSSLGEVIDEDKFFEIDDKILACSESCYDFFEEKLDLQKTIKPLIERINKLTGFDYNITKLLDYSQPAAGIIESFIDLKPAKMLSGVSSSYQALKDYAIKPFGVGLPVMEKIIRHIFQKKLKSNCSWTDDVWQNTYVVTLDCKLVVRETGQLCSELKANSFDDVSLEFAKQEGAERESHALEYAQKLKAGEDLGFPLYVSGKVLNTLGANISDNEMYMLDGARRIGASVLAHKETIKIQLLLHADELSELLSIEKCIDIQKTVADLTWFENYQSIPLVGLKGERSFKRFSLMDMDLLRDATVMDFGCNIGQACLKAASAGAKQVYGIEGMADTYRISKKIAQTIGFNNVEYANVDFNSLDFDLQIDNVYKEKVDYTFFFSVYRTKELTQRDRLFEYIINKTKKGMFFEGHAHRVIDTIDYYDWLFESFGLEYKFLGYSEDNIRPLFFLPMEGFEGRDKIRKVLAEDYYSNEIIIDDGAYDYKVSAIVSAYASERLIEGRLQDLLNQTIADDLEIVVVDTGSPENEGEIVRRYMKNNLNIKYIRVEERETVYQAWNRGVRAAKGRYLITANTDDRLRNDALEVMSTELDNKTNCALVYGDFLITPFDNMTFENHIRTGYSLKPDYSPGIMLSGCHMGSQPMWRACVHKELGYFDEELKYSSDYEFWCKVAVKYPMTHVNQFLGLYQHNPSSITNTNIEAMGHEAREVKERYADKLPPVDQKTPTGFYLREHLETEKYANFCMVTYNRLDFTKKALSSILMNTRYPHVITVIDNNSTDGTREYLQSLKNSGVIKNLVLLDDNIGFAKASNIAWMLEPDAAYYVRCDNDMVVQKPNWLIDMVAIAEKIPSIAVLGYNVEPKSYPIKDIQGIRFRVKKGNIGGGCVFVSKQAHNKLGFWCEDYGLYGEEDFDYGFRAILSKMLNIYMEDEDAFFHLPAGKAAAINSQNMEATDGLEEVEDKKYRLWKDEQRRMALQKRAENIQFYQENTSDLYCMSNVLDILDVDLSSEVINNQSLINVIFRINKYLSKGRKAIVRKLVDENFSDSDKHKQLIEKIG